MHCDMQGQHRRIRRCRQICLRHVERSYQGCSVVWMVGDWTWRWRRELRLQVYDTAGISRCRKTYIGSTEPPFKLRYGNHKTSIKLPGYRKSTGLSKHVWELKDNGKTHDIKWRVVQKAKAYSNITKRCSLCLEEKARIITADRRSSLNKRSELISKCRHQNKFMLSTLITWSSRHPASRQ